MLCYREREPITLQQTLSDENAVSLIVALRGGAKEPSCGVNRGVRHIPPLSIAARINDAGNTVAIRAVSARVKPAGGGNRSAGRAAESCDQAGRFSQFFTGRKSR